MCKVGDAVTANWLQRGTFYGATIVGVSIDGTITVDWDDNDTPGRELQTSDVLKGGVPCSTGYTDDTDDTGAPTTLAHVG